MLGQQGDVAKRSIARNKNKANKKSTDNQNKIQELKWTSEPWEAQKAASSSQQSTCDTIKGLCAAAAGQSMEPYVVVRYLKAEGDAREKRTQTGFMDRTKSVNMIGGVAGEAIFRDSDNNELLEECMLKKIDHNGKELYPDPGALLVFVRVYDDDVGDDDCLGQAILDIREVVDNRSGQESFSEIAIYDEEHGELMCHLEMSACWTKNDEGGTLSIKVYRLYDFREDIDADEGLQALKYMAIFLIYILIGAALFKALESKEWGCNAYFDAVWFMVITITSVGYGDCFPETDGTKALNFVMIITNILCIGWMFSIAVQQMIVMQAKLEQKLRGSIQNTMWAKGEEAEGEEEHAPAMSKYDDFRTTTIMCVTLIVLTCMVYGLNGDEMCMVMVDNGDGTSSPSSCPADLEDCTGASKVSGDAVCRTNDAGFMNFWDVLQFTVVTMATVGYGDVSPKTTWGKVYGMFFAMIGVAALARLGALVVDSVMDAAHKAKMEKVLGQTLTSLDELDVFDDDGDGRIDKYEFLMKMLVMTHETSQDTIDRIMGRFAQVDVDGDGDIDAEDFLAMMSKKKDKIMSPRGETPMNGVTVDAGIDSSALTDG